MPKLIHHFSLPAVDELQEVALPDSYRILHVAPGADGGLVKIWYSRDDADLSMSPYHFQIVGTGHKYSERGIYIGTAVGPVYVWHVIRHIKLPIR